MSEKEKVDKAVELYNQGKFKEAHKQRTLSKHNDSLNKVIKKDVKSAVEEWIENAMIPDDITVMDIRL